MNIINNLNNILSVHYKLNLLNINLYIILLILLYFNIYYYIYIIYSKI